MQNTELMHIPIILIWRCRSIALGCALQVGPAAPTPIADRGLCCVARGWWRIGKTWLMCRRQRCGGRYLWRADAVLLQLATRDTSNKRERRANLAVRREMMTLSIHLIEGVCNSLACRCLCHLLHSSKQTQPYLLIIHLSTRRRA